MDDGARTRADEPGETRRPDRRRLERAPSSANGGASEVAAIKPRFGRALLQGGLATAGVAGAWALAAGLLDVSWGLIFVAALGGWVIGTAVGLGAWGGLAHPPDPRLPAIGAGCGVLAWLVGSFGAYLVGLLVLPGSGLSLGERMANVPFGDALATQISLVDIAAIALLAGIAWRSAR